MQVIISIRWTRFIPPAKVNLHEATAHRADHPALSGMGHLISHDPDRSDNLPAGLGRNAPVRLGRGLAPGLTETQGKPASSTEDVALAACRGALQ